VDRKSFIGRLTVVVERCEQDSAAGYFRRYSFMKRIVA
jgi:hypothetical protein